MASSKPSKHLTLLLSDSLPPVGFARPAATPVLDMLLGRSRVLQSGPSALEPAVLRAFGLAASTNAIAPITRLVDLPDAEGLPNEAWLRADPVHLAISRDNAQLFDSHVVRPTAEEMHAIATTMNQHFAASGGGDKIHISFPDPARGYIATAANNVPISTPLWQMGGANVFDNLPLSKTKTNWRAVSNEMQMLLHAHPVNLAREALGVPTINGLWIWGGGSLEDVKDAVDPAIEPPRFTHVMARLVLARGLARAADMPLSPLPTRFDEANIDAPTLVVLHSATREIRAQGRETWPAEIAALERDWIAPAVTALDAHQLDELTVLLPNESCTLTLEVTRGNIFRKLAAMVSTKRKLADFL